MNSVRDIKLRVLQAMLNPVLRYCVRNAITIQEISEASKSSLVDIASKHLLSQGQKVSDSRLCVMTGLHRREVRRFLEEPNKPVTSNNLVARVLGKWEQDPMFSRRKKARPLTYSGSDSEFQTLVKSITNDVGPVAVLKTLKQLGSVEIEKGKVRIVDQIYNREGNEEDLAELISLDTVTLADVVEQNKMQVNKEKNLHLRTEYDNIILSEIPQIRRWLLEKGGLFHKLIRDYISQFDQDILPKDGVEGGGRISVTSFSCTEPINPKNTD